MRTKLYIAAYTTTIIFLTLIIIIGFIQVRSNSLKYGFRYEIITITNGDEPRTNVSLSMNMGFLIFLSMIIYLLAIPLIDHVKDYREEKKRWLFEMSVKCVDCGRFTSLNKFRCLRYIIKFLGDHGVCSECDEDIHQFWHIKIQKGK